MFERRPDGTVRMTFKPPPSAPQEPPRLSFTYSSRLSFTYSSMITTVQTAQEDLPITGFNSDGFPVYPANKMGISFGMSLVPASVTQIVPAGMIGKRMTIM